MEICFYQRDIWESKFSLSEKCITKALSIVTYSPFGKYIAAASMNGQMLVWDVETKMCISKKLHEKEITVCSLKWHPSGKELAFCDVEGQLGVYSSPLSSVSDLDVVQDLPLPVTSDIDEFNDDDEDSAFDIGAIKASLEPKIFGENSVVEDIEIQKKEPETKIQVIEAPKAPVQKAFQPSSTPSSLDRRFMLWNNVGIVRCYDTEEENSIDVEFHDANVYHPLHINNTRNHALAALSTEALLLSSPKLEENS
ncbi:WD repeat and HMG-box DNA-binding protein 1, partial [Nephila pilipes]